MPTRIRVRMRPIRVTRREWRKFYYCLDALHQWQNLDQFDENIRDLLTEIFAQVRHRQTKSGISVDTPSRSPRDMPARLHHNMPGSSPHRSLDPNRFSTHCSEEPKRP